MELALKIYDDAGEVVKTFQRSGFKVKMKILKRFIKIVDLNALAALLGAEEKESSEESNKRLIAEIGKMVSGSYELIEELTLSVFPEMTPEEFEEIAIDDLAVFVINMVKFSAKTVGLAATGKN